MTEYEFNLKFNLHNHQIDPNDYIDRLYESGCDDALIGIGKNGYIPLDFVRSSSSAYEAISALLYLCGRALKPWLVR